MTASGSKAGAAAARNHGWGAKDVQLRSLLSKGSNKIGPQRHIRCASPCHNFGAVLLWLFPLGSKAADRIAMIHALEAAVAARACVVLSVHTSGHVQRWVAGSGLAQADTCVARVVERQLGVILRAWCHDLQWRSEVCAAVCVTMSGVVRDSSCQQETL